MSIENRMLRSTHGPTAEGAIFGSAEGSIVRENLQLRTEGGTGLMGIGIVSSGK